MEMFDIGDAETPPHPALSPTFVGARVNLV
jgi:hypothetical protein